MYFWRDMITDHGLMSFNMFLIANAPIIVSQPHFYQGDQKYIDAIEGLHPSEQHETFIDIEPVSFI